MINSTLYISGNLFPATAGDSILSQGLIERLFKITDLDVCSYGSEQDLLNTNFSDRKEHFFLTNKRVLKTSISKRILRFGSIKQVYSDELNLIIKKRLQQKKYSHIIVDHLRAYSLAKEMYDIFKRENIKLIYVAHNIEYHNLNENIRFINSWLEKLKLYLFNLNLKNLEFDILNKADITWALTNEDKIHLKSINPNGVYKIIPPYFKWGKVKPLASLNNKTKKLLILGSMDWYPNILGTLHFVENIFSKLINIDSNYKLYIVGKNPNREIRNLKSESIIVTGRVHSVDAYIKDCDLLVIPNRLGNGIKIKFYESISKGLPVISYSENIAGYKSELLKLPFVVSNEQEFIDSIIEVISNFELKKQFLNSFKFENKLDNKIFKINS